MVHGPLNVKSIKIKHFSHQDMSNITNLHCTQNTPYTVSPTLKRFQVTQTCRYKNSVPSAAWKQWLYLNSFSTLTYMVISNIYTVNPLKSIQLIQMSDNPYKYQNFHSLFSTHFKQHTFQEDRTYTVLLPNAASCTVLCEL